jgi:hypothetical protein
VTALSLIKSHFWPERHGRSGENGTLTQQPLELAHEAVAAVDVELGRKLQHLFADVEKYRRGPRVAAQHLLETLDAAVGQHPERQLDVQILLAAMEQRP